MSVKTIEHLNNEGKSALDYAMDNDLENLAKSLASKMTPEALSSINRQTGDTIFSYTIHQQLWELTELLLTKVSYSVINSINIAGNSILIDLLASKKEALATMFLNFRY